MAVWPSSREELDVGKSKRGGTSTQSATHSMNASKYGISRVNIALARSSKEELPSYTIHSQAKSQRVCDISGCGDIKQGGTYLRSSPTLSNRERQGRGRNKTNENSKGG